MPSVRFQFRAYEVSAIIVGMKFSDWQGGGFCLDSAEVHGVITPAVCAIIAAGEALEKVAMPPQKCPTVRCSHRHVLERRQTIQGSACALLMPDFSQALLASLSHTARHL